MGRAGAVAWTGAAGASRVMGRVGAIVWTGAMGGWSSAHPGYVSGAARGCDVAAQGGRRGGAGVSVGLGVIRQGGGLLGAVQHRDVAVLAIRTVSWVLLVIRRSDMAVVGVAVWW